MTLCEIGFCNYLRLKKFQIPSVEDGSNSLINSPFAPLPVALCLCRKASSGRHPVDWGLAYVLWILSSGFRAAVGRLCPDELSSVLYRLGINYQG